MGFDYALVHAKYTIPPALILTFIYRPLISSRDIYRILFLITVAVVYTIPWDSYLIRTNIWSYPQSAVLGYTLFDIPVEELFFFVIQTYDVSVFYLLLSRATFHPIYLSTVKPNASSTRNSRIARASISFAGLVGQIALGLAVSKAISMVREGSNGTYMGLIMLWALPIVLFLWSLIFPFMLRLPVKNVLIPIVVATVYLWAVDTLALRRGTWVISSDTKYGLHVVKGLDIEEAFFFLVTNVLVVFGQVAFDNAVAILDAFPDLFPDQTLRPSPYRALKAILVPATSWDTQRIEGLSEAVKRLRAKSRSFYLASATFTGRLRIDLILLYSFCRVADDLIDGAADYDESKEWVARLKKYLDLAYPTIAETKEQTSLVAYVEASFPAQSHLALLQLPFTYLSKEHLYDLLKGFELDLEFTKAIAPHTQRDWPIKDDGDLELYGKYVAGTIGELCLDLVFHHHRESLSADQILGFKTAAVKMGIALQTVNIARDIAVDAAMHRVYIPLTWLKAEGLTPEDVLRSPEAAQITDLRSKLLDKAFELYGEARGSVEGLPVSARGPMRVAIESYMEIGRVLRQKNYKVKRGKATVPVLRRIIVGWKALNG